MTGSEQQETVLVFTASDADSEDEMSTDNGAKGSCRSKYILWSVLAVVLVLCLVAVPAASLDGTAIPLTLRRPERPIQVYTPEQATRAAKAAVARLQLIEQRRPYAAATANPFALPVTQETDLSRERRH